MGLSPTYRAPESKFKDEVTQSHDVWSLGCVLLGFENWYLSGFEGLKTFNEKRVNDDMQYDGGHTTDRLFNSMKPSQVVPDDNQGRAQLDVVQKASVLQVRISWK